MSRSTAEDSTPSPASGGFLDHWFEITKRGSSIGTELRGGLVTFFAMAYIVVLNPLILGNIPDRNGDTLTTLQVAGVTALVAGVMSIAFGIGARYPFGIATGLGINTLLAVTFVQVEGLTWAEAMGLVVWDGIIIVILAITGFRTMVFNAIPTELKAAITVGIGLFISFIGFVDAGFVRRLPDAANTTVPVGLGIGGSIGSWPTVVFLFGLILCGVLTARKVRGGLFIGIISTTVVAIIVEMVAKPGPSMVDGEPVPTGWSLAVPQIPDQWFGIPDLSLVGKVDMFGAFTSVGPLTAALLLFTLVLANFFDAMGTMTGLGHQAELMDDDGNLPGLKPALIFEGLGAVAGGLGSSSSNTVYVDSAAGIADGARTGLANVVTGAVFLLAMFLTPLTQIVPFEAASPVLVIVGALMIGQITSIDFNRFEIALPAFLTIVAMPFTYSIANGIGIGFIVWTLLQALSGKVRSIHPIMWAISVAFVIYFGAQPLTAAISG